MKINKIILAFSFLVLAFASCDRNLPYDLDGVQRGVAVSVRVGDDNSPGIIAGSSAGDFSVTLSIPSWQGDYSNLKDVDLVAIFTPKGQATRRVVFREGITTFPTTIDIDLDELFQDYLGQPTSVVGDALSFVVDIKTTDGLEIPGWTTYGGYNSKLSGNPDYSYRAVFNILDGSHPLFKYTSYYGDWKISFSNAPAAGGWEVIEPYDIQVLAGSEDNELILVDFVASKVYGLSCDLTLYVDLITGIVTYEPVTGSSTGYGAFILNTVNLEPDGTPDDIIGTPIYGVTTDENNIKMDDGFGFMAFQVSSEATFGSVFTNMTLTR